MKKILSILLLTSLVTSCGPGSSLRDNANYEILVGSGNSMAVYFANSYTLDSNKCISFNALDEGGLVKICGSYTLLTLK
jgi:hypothetical protein